MSAMGKPASSLGEKYKVRVNGTILRESKILKVI